MAKAKQQAQKPSGYQFGSMMVYSPDLPSDAEQNKSLKAEQRELQQKYDYLVSEIDKIHTEKDNDPHSVAKGIYDFGMAGTSPFASTYAPESFRKNKLNQNTINDLRTFAYELPMAPQAIEFLISSCFAHGYSISPRKGKKENKPLRTRIEKFFGNANDNNSSLLDVFKTAWRNSIQVGDGYIELVKGTDKNKREYLTEVYHIDPSNIIIEIDQELAKVGQIKILKYVKIEGVNATSAINQSLDDVPEEAKLDPDEIIHIRFRDEGGTYGRSNFEFGQQISRLILNVINMNSKKFSNEVKHSLWIKMGMNMTQFDSDRFLAQYRANYLGKGNFGKPLVTYGGIEVVPLEKGKEQDFAYEQFMKEIGNNHASTLLNIAPSELLNNDAKYSNASQGHVTTMLNTVFPLQARMETIINEQILPALEGIEAKSDQQSTYIFSLEREAINALWDLADLALAPQRGYMTVNEWRKLVDPKNLQPIKEDWADKHFVLLGKGQSLAWMDDPSTYFGGDDEVAEGEDPNEDTTETTPQDDQKPKKPKPQKRYLQ